MQFLSNFLFTCIYISDVVSGYMFTGINISGLHKAIGQLCMTTIKVYVKESCNAHHCMLYQLL